MRNDGGVRIIDFNPMVQKKDEILSTVIIYSRVRSCEIIEKDEW